MSLRGIDLVIVRENTEDLYTGIDKANIMKLSDGLFIKAAEDASRRYPAIAYEHKLVDNMCMQLVQFPEKYDVFEATHDSAPDSRSVRNQLMAWYRANRRELPWRNS